MTVEGLLQEVSAVKNYQYRLVENGSSQGDNNVQAAEKCKNKKQNNAKMASATQDVANGGDSVLSDIIKARQSIKLSLASEGSNPVSSSLVKTLESRVEKLEDTIKNLYKEIENLKIKCNATSCPAKSAPVCPAKPPSKVQKPAAKDDDDDDVDLFGSDDDQEADELRKKRLEEYAQKKSKKPAAVAKSSVVLDVKPWDDETDMEEMQRLVRTIEMDGLVWGASKLVPLAFGIKKLQIVSVIEDEKVSVEELSEKIEAFEDFVQSVDVAAFNKI